MWMQSCSAAKRIITLVVLMSAVIGSSPAVQAQGFRTGLSTALPRPISSLDLTRYAAAMNLAPEQVRAWNEMHERYKADFALLGEEGGAILLFIEARKAAEGIPFRAQPPKAELERWLSSHQSACNAIAALDDRVFDELAPLLVENQQPPLQRAKLARERARLAGDEFVQQWLDSSNKADLCELFVAIEDDAPAELMPEPRAAVWSMLDGYQARYVASLREIQSVTRDMYRAWSKALHEQGVPPDALKGDNRDEAQHRMFQILSAAWDQATANVKPRALALAQLNRESARAVAALLPSETGRTFRDEFLLTRTEFVASLRHSERTVRRVMEMEDLTPEERAAMTTHLNAFIAQADVLAEAIADASDDLAAIRRPSISVESDPGVFERHREAAEAVVHASKAATQGLAEIISTERLTAFFDQGMEARLRKWVRDNGVTDPEEIEELVTELQQTGTARLGKRESLDGAVADAISRSEIDALVSRLELEDSARVVRQLQAEYRRQYRKQFDDSSDAMNELRIGFMTRGEEKDGHRMSSYAPPEDVDKAIALERQTIASLRRLDAALFDDLQAALGVDADALWRARLARDWSVLARGGRKGMDELRAYEAYVPLPAIVDGLALSQEESGQVDAILRARAEAIRAVAQAHFDANRAAWFARDMHLAHSIGPVRASAEVSAAKEAEAMKLEQAAEKNRLALAALTKSILDELCAALPARAEALCDGYERAAYPRVFKDSNDAGPLLANALALKDVNDPQRTELQAAAEAFRPAYRDVCVRMIAVNLEWDAQTQYTPEGQKKRDEAKYKWDQLAFERNELNSGVRATLARVLTTEQRAVIGLSSE